MTDCGGKGKDGASPPNLSNQSGTLTKIFFPFATNLSISGYYSQTPTATLCRTCVNQLTHTVLEYTISSTVVAFTI